MNSIQLNKHFVIIKIVNVKNACNQYQEMFLKFSVINVGILDALFAYNVKKDLELIMLIINKTFFMRDVYFPIF